MSGGEPRRPTQGCRRFGRRLDVDVVGRYDGTFTDEANVKRIVIIEDNPTAANIYQSTLKRQGFNVEVATDGELGLAAVVGSRPDLVLLDLMLPKIDGVELLRRMRATESLAGMPIVVMSNAYTQARLDALTEAGATRIVPKASMSPKQLLAIVQELTEKAAPPS